MIRKRVPLFLVTLGLTLTIALAANRQADQTSASASQLPDPGAPAAIGAVSIHLDGFAAGLNQPVGIANAGDYRLFVIEKVGTIKVLDPDGTVHGSPFLDIRDRVASSGLEEGLLGLAFHPQYRVNGYFYVNYTNITDNIRRTRISRFEVTGDRNVADAGSENILLTVEQPVWNHNAGKILFGPDGYLYIPLGDGGGGGDPLNNAQNMSLLLGKISRIDVDGNAGLTPDCAGLGSGAYAIPADNPFLDGAGGQCDEIWALGFRNPWQSSFDSLTGDLYVGDVGQNKVEEVDFQPADSTGGENYGWRCYEGSDPYNTSGCDASETYTYPIFEYGRPTAYGDCSVTGGYVYRGHTFPALFGRYLLTDYCSGRFWDLQQMPDGSWLSTEHNDPTLLRLGNAAFGERCDGELFVANVVRGEIYRLLESSPSADGRVGPTLPVEFEPDTWVYLPQINMPGCR